MRRCYSKYFKLSPPVRRFYLFYIYVSILLRLGRQTKLHVPQPLSPRSHKGSAFILKGTRTLLSKFNHLVYELQNDSRGASEPLNEDVSARQHNTRVC